MVGEGQVLSQMQTAEVVLNSSNCTFNSDDTSRDHKKIVGTQLSLDSGEKELVESTGEPLGRDKSDVFSRFFADNETVTTRVIRTACDVLGPCGDQKNGCHSDWITFCPNSKIPNFKEDPPGLMDPSFYSVFDEGVDFHCPEMTAVTEFLNESNVNIISNKDQDDLQLQCLRITLLTTGKGRRPALPPLTMNNQLLYQIYLLKIEGHRPASEVEFTRLFPNSDYPADRFNRRVDKVAEKASTLSETELKEFSEKRVDFDFLTPALLISME
ncbi:hypothetical protein RRG08_036382 [Elysia crispata]|uniref:Uncharacterized protein n=1 Tax=Elysia crispata TaxID=231223 RepID=A0AAE0ZK27_9GAST|nr:hypothetical protein RRG08_036382 [Elysia crispata]